MKHKMLSNLLNIDTSVNPTSVVHFPSLSYLPSSARSGLLAH